MRVGWYCFAPYAGRHRVQNAVFSAIAKVLDRLKSGRIRMLFDGVFLYL